jgi:hypothetical protein
MQPVLWTLYKRVAKPLSSRGIGTRFPVIKALHDSITRHLRADVAEVQGHKMFLPAEDGSLLSNLLSFYGTYEPLETEIVKKEI